MNTTLQSPFSLITEPTTVRRILLSEGLLDVAKEIVGDGFCFVPIECREYWGLVIAAKEPDGAISHRVVTCKKEAGPHRMSAGFAAVMEDLSNRCGHQCRFKIDSVDKN